MRAPLRFWSRLVSGDHERSIVSPLDLFEGDFELPGSRADLIRKIRWIIRIRYIVSPSVVLLMLFTSWQGLTQAPELTRAAIFSVLITGGVAVAFNIVYQLALKKERNLQRFVFWQMAVDILLFSSYVYRSGGVVSPFTFLYLLPIIAGAILVSGRAAAGLAGLSVLCYGLIAFLETSGVIVHISYFVALDDFAQKWSYVILMVIMNSVGFFSVAALASQLTKAIRGKTDALAQATTTLDRRAALLAMLVRVSRTGVEARDADEAVEVIAKLLAVGLDLDRVLVYLVDEGGDNLVLARRVYHPRLEGKADHSALSVTIPLREDAGVTAHCALTRIPINVTDPADHPLINRELAERIGINPFAVAPLVMKGRLLGVIGVDRSQGIIDDEAFPVLVAFADQAAHALWTAQLEYDRDDLPDGLEHDGPLGVSYHEQSEAHADPVEAEDEDGDDGDDGDDGGDGPPDGAPDRDGLQLEQGGDEAGRAGGQRPDDERRDPEPA